jgi:isopenicillin N synthase-like dioxygenase
LADKDDVEALRLAAPDLKESLEIGRDDEEGCPNMWPSTEDEEGKEFKKVSMEFFDTCKIMHMQVMRAIAAGLGIDESWFDGYTDRGDNTLRLLHYPPVKKEVFDKNKLQVRAGEHSDYGKCLIHSVPLR